MLTPFLKRPLQKPLTGLELPRHKAVYRLADKPSRGAVAQFGQIVCELSQLGEGVHRGAADLRRISLMSWPAVPDARLAALACRRSVIIRNSWHDGAVEGRSRDRDLYSVAPIYCRVNLGVCGDVLLGSGAVR